MRLLVSGATSTIREFKAGHPWLGHLLTPRGGNDPAKYQLPWAADNDAFNNFDPQAFMAMLDRIVASGARPLWIAAPDNVGNAEATLRRFEIWEPMIHALELPVALVGQDGLETIKVPWERFECFFVGGSTEWKLGPEAARLMAEAKRRRKQVHIGRVNSLKRLEYAMRCGADTVDGSGFSLAPRRHIPWAICKIAAHQVQPELWD